MSKYRKDGSQYIKDGYFHYGEGSVSHNGNPCAQGITSNWHPQMVRETWPSRWAYEKNKVARWWAHREFGRLILHEDSYDIRKNPFDPLMHRLFGEPFPRNPHLYVCFHPKDSIYIGREEESQRAQERYEARLKERADE